MKRNKILFYIFLVFIVYTIMLFIRIYQTKRLDNAKLNLKRENLGLQQFSKTWSLHKQEFLGYGNYSELELEKRKKCFTLLEDKRLYMKDWKVNENQVKRIFYFESVWILNNKVLAEADIYNFSINQLSDIRLYLLYDYIKKEWDCSIDTLESEFKIRMDKKTSDSLQLLYPNAIKHWHPFLYINEIDTTTLPVEFVKEQIELWKRISK